MLDLPLGDEFMMSQLIDARSRPLERLDDQRQCHLIISFTDEMRYLVRFDFLDVSFEFRS